MYYDCSIQFITAVVLTGTCTQEERLKTFESQGNQEMRLQFLKKFTEKQSALFNMSVEPSTANAKVKKDQGIPGAHLVNQAE